MKKDRALRPGLEFVGLGVPTITFERGTADYYSADRGGLMAPIAAVETLCDVPWPPHNACDGNASHALSGVICARSHQAIRRRPR